MKNKIYATAILVGLIGFLYPLSSLLIDLNSWQVWDQPSTAGKLIRCLIFGLIAFAGAIGINVKDLILPYLPSNFNSSSNTVSQSKLNEINSDKNASV